MISAGRFVRDHTPDELDTTARLVAFALAAFSDAAGHARPSSRQLAASTGLHPETIARAIRRLEAVGMIAVQRRDRAVSRYRFPVQAPIGELSTSARPRAAQNSYPHLRGSAGESARPRAAHLKNHVEENARVHTDDRGTFIPGTGWLTQPTAQEA
jgi:DNA-binding transcriptional MocR family regulator